MDLVLDRLLALSNRAKEPAGDAAAGLRRLLAALDLRHDPKGAGPDAADPSGSPAESLVAAERPRFVVIHQRAPASPFGEVLLLLPAGSTGEDGGRAFELPAGSLWIRARFLVPGAAGYAGLRIRGGRLELGARALALPEGRFSVVPTQPWTLSVEPAPPPAAEAGGSDAHALALTLPERLEVRSNGAPAVAGALAMAGFGSALDFVPAAGAPTAGAGAIDFPFAPPAGESAVWTVDGNRSAAAQLAGSCPVASAAWSLPVVSIPSDAMPETAGEAAHGGSLVARLRDGFRLRLPGVAAAAFRAFDTVLTADAARLRLEVRQAQAAGRLELDLWRPAQSRCVFGREAIGRLLFASERTVGDVVLVEGGRLRNRWDLPLAAAGEPFPFEGRIEVFAVTALPSGLHLSCVAAEPPGGRTHGLALENLYLTVHRPRRLAFFGSWDGAAAVADGTALLFFDVALAQPMLPDPYAANWPLPDGANGRENGLSLTLRWAGAAPPAIEGRLEGRIAFPVPRGLPDDEDPLLRALFDRHLGSRREPLSLLDLSSRDHHLGVALENLSDQEVALDGNLLTVRLRGVRLLMQPQVQWEPVQVVPNPAANVHQAETATSATHGARTLAGADHVKLVPVLPGLVSQEWVQAAREGRPCGALFSLPFGLRAFARLDAREAVPRALPPIEAGLHAVELAGLASARQMRLTATGGQPPGQRPADRSMPGALRQLQNLAGSANNLGSVLGNEIELQLTEFLERIPLHQADLSGYGLSAFSDWRRETDVGVTQMRFDVLTGRTSLEVVQTRTVLAACQARAVRTVILERRNSGRVKRFDSGWQPIDDGTFSRYAPFDRGVVVAFRNLRNIRILPRPLVALSDGSVWQAVLYDCDAELEDVTAGGPGGRVPVRDHAGYVQIAPTGAGAAPTPARFAALFAQVGLLGGPLDCALRVGGTLPFQASGLFVDASPDGSPVTSHAAVAVYGSPGLPRAGQWSAVRIAGAIGAGGEAAPVDPRHGVPVIRLPGQPYAFRDPADARRAQPAAEHGFLMSTATSRVLFPGPRSTRPRRACCARARRSPPIRSPSPRRPASSRGPPLLSAAPSRRDSRSPTPAPGA